MKALLSLAAPLLAITLVGAELIAQDPPVQPPVRRQRVSPPQPQQSQSVDYFVGRWTFTWVGRESAVTAGPREGTLTYTRRGTTSVLDVRAEGTLDGGAKYAETGTAEWSADKKIITWVERLSTGMELRSVGDWSSPIGIRAESEPVKGGTQTIRVRRLYSILSPQSYMVTEEISVNGGPYQRLGSGRFHKVS